MRYSCQAGVYTASFVIGTVDQVLLISTHSMMIANDRVIQNYRQVTEFPDAWEPIPDEWNQTLDSFPLGEYCLTSQGTYRRWRTVRLVDGDE